MSEIGVTSPPPNVLKTAEVQERKPINKEVTVQWEGEEGGFVVASSVDFGPAYSFTRWGFDKDGNVSNVGFLKVIGDDPENCVAQVEELQRDPSGNWIKTTSESNEPRLAQWNEEYRKYEEGQKSGEQQQPSSLISRISQLLKR